MIRSDTYRARISLLALLAFAPVLRSESVLVFESGHVRPLALAPSGNFLIAVNTADNRVQVFHPEHGSLLARGETVVGLEPVAVAVRDDTEAYVVNHLSDSVSVLDVSDADRPFVKLTLLVGDEPRDVVIGGPDRDKIFITTAHRGQNRPGDSQPLTPSVGRADVWVFDADNLEAEPTILTLFCDTPRALAVSPDGTRVFAAAFRSGNRTSVVRETAVNPFFSFLIGDGFISPDLPSPRENDDGVRGPGTGLIVQQQGEVWVDAIGRDWTPRMRFDLPDRDVFEIDAAANPPVVLRSHSGVGTTIFNLAVHPRDGSIWASNLEALNQVRFELELRGHIVENRVTVILGAEVRPVHLNPHIDYSVSSGSDEEIAQSLAFPLGMEFSADGERLFVAAFGSEQVGVLDANGAVVARIDVGGGPSGVVLHDLWDRLYVMNRFDDTISVVDLESLEERHVVPLRYSPESRSIRRGRRLLYDARGSSGHGDAACGSCHIFGDDDALAWNLGDPSGSVEPNPLESAVPQEGVSLPGFHPLKGPMLTQSFRGLAGAGAMHWRGDRNGGEDRPSSAEAAFLSFRPAFESLLGRPEPLPESEMRELLAFALAIRYPPNPIASLDGMQTEDEILGEEIFLSDGDREGTGGDGMPCTDCHQLPIGTGGRAVVAGNQPFKVPHLRSLYQRVGMFGTAVPKFVSDDTLEAAPTAHLGEQVRGFGYTHDGGIPSLIDFLRQPLGTFIFPGEPGRPSPRKVEQLAAFVLTFPTGLGPIVGQQVTLTQTNIGAVRLRIRLLDKEADAGAGDLVVHGIVRDEPRGYVSIGSIDGETHFQSDREDEIVSLCDLQILASTEEATVTFTVVPTGSGRRIGIDRDEDGALDRDEIEAGFDPADSRSRPGGAAPLVVRGDCNADGRLDISDASFSLALLFVEGGDVPCELSCDTNGDSRFNLSDAIYGLSFLFRGGPSPGSYPECEEAEEGCEQTCEEV
jgi:sugar lactone lactonase YvrE